MSTTPPDKITVQCTCGAKLRVPATAVGKKFKCPKCGGVVAVKKPAAKTPAPAPLGLSDDSGDLLGDLAQHEDEAIASTTAPSADGSTPCPGCGAKLAPDAMLCVACGYDTRKGKRRSAAKALAAPSAAATAAKKAAKTAGNFVIGCTLSAVGALIGAGVWYGISTASGYEIGWIAWGVGVVAGLGMLIGYRDSNSAAGMVAAGMAVLGIVAGKAMVFFWVAIPMLTGNTSDLEQQRDYVQTHITHEIIAADDRIIGEPTDQQWDAAWARAGRDMAHMTPDVIRTRWREYRDASDVSPDAQAEAIATGGNFFSMMFGAMDLLFIGLALVSAYKIAAGLTSDE